MKTSDLPALIGTDVDTAADLIPIVDMSLTGLARNKKITVAQLLSLAGLSTEGVQDVVGAMAAAGTGISVSYDDTAGTLTITNTAPSAGTYTDENARDAIGAALTAGTGISVTVNDGADTITLAVDTTAEAERIRDVIGAALVAGSNITLTVNDAGDTITIDAAGGSVGGAYDNPLSHAAFGGI